MREGGCLFPAARVCVPPSSLRRSPRRLLRAHYGPRGHTHALGEAHLARSALGLCQRILADIHLLVEAAHQVADVTQCPAEERELGRVRGRRGRVGKTVCTAIANGQGFSRPPAAAVRTSCYQRPQPGPCQAGPGPWRPGRPARSRHSPAAEPAYRQLPGDTLRGSGVFTPQMLPDCGRRAFNIRGAASAHVVAAATCRRAACGGGKPSVATSVAWQPGSPIWVH